MKALFTAIQSLFVATPHNDLYTALSGQMYPGFAPQGTVLPYAATSFYGVPVYDLQAKADENVTFQLDLFSKTETEVLELYDKAKALFDEATFAMDGYQLIQFKRVLFRKTSDEFFRRITVQYQITIGEN